MKVRCRDPLFFTLEHTQNTVRKITYDGANRRGTEENKLEKKIQEEDRYTKKLKGERPTHHMAVQSKWTIIHLEGLKAREWAYSIPLIR